MACAALRGARPLAFWAFWVALAVCGGGAASAQQGCPGALEVLLERPYAEDAGIAVGASVRMRASAESPSCPATVAGVFEPPPDPASLYAARPRAIFHLPHLLELSGRGGEVDYFTVLARPGVDAAALAADMAPMLPGAQVLPVGEVAARSSTTFEVVSRFHAAIAAITLVAGGVFLACVMVLKVQERRGPVAAARLAGVPRRFLFWWTAAEAALLAALGGAAGLGVGLGASALVNAYYQCHYDTALVFSRVTGEVAAQALALALVLGLAAGAFAAARMLASDPRGDAGR